MLDERREGVDAIVVIDPGTAAKLERGERPALRVLGRNAEENSKLAVQRVSGVLHRWGDDVRAVRFARAGLPADFDRPLEIPNHKWPKDLAAAAGTAYLAYIDGEQVVTVRP